MNSRAFVCSVAIVVVCACLVGQSEARWRDRFDINEISQRNPRVKGLLDGPLGPLVDVIVEILLYMIDFMLGGAFAPLQRMEGLENEVKELREMLMLKGGK